MSVIAFAAPSRSWTPSLPYRVGVVETNQPLPIRRVQSKRVTQPVRALGRDFGSYRDELHPVSGFVHEQRLTVKVEQGVEPRVTVMFRHRHKLSVTDNKRKFDAEDTWRKFGAGEAQIPFAEQSDTGDRWFGSVHCAIRLRKRLLDASARRRAARAKSAAR